MTGPDPQPRKPVILTVDDDPAVSRAVARDLRRHYGEKYRIVRAESGPDALETMNELKLRGDDRRGVRRRLPDAPDERHRVPRRGHGHLSDGAPGAADRIRRHPRGDRRDQRRRPGPLPTEAVGSAGREALPGDRRPADGLAREGDRAIPVTKVIGHPWNPSSSEVRQFLARNQLYFRHTCADEPKGKQLLDAAGLDGLQLPVVITEGGETLVDPTNGELADMLGLSTTPSLPMYELVVIGGGPAGLAAAVYGASEGLKTVLIERTTTGGQAGRSSRIENYLGFPDRNLGRRAHHVGPQAGRAVRRRGHHDPQGDRTRRQRPGSHDRVRGRQHHRCPGRHFGHRRRLPPTAGLRLLGQPRRQRVQLHRPRRLLRRLGFRRRGVPGRGRIHRRWAPTRPGRRRCTCRARRSP